MLTLARHVAVDYYVLPFQDGGKLAILLQSYEHSTFFFSSVAAGKNT
ncbi:MAG: hypothetical protein LBK82_06525 [Planctomycetaceae bacterium]|jgi:hypothetical protein|nr:hypothetical protein [Planctomycetaceae bacterium]